ALDTLPKGMTMQDRTSPRQRVQTQLRDPIPLSQRLGYSLSEFAALFGRSPTWGYRQIYAGRVKPVADCGRLIIPRAELERVLSSAARYNPQPHKPKTQCAESSATIGGDPQ